MIFNLFSSNLRTSLSVHDKEGEGGESTYYSSTKVVTPKSALKRVEYCILPTAREKGEVCEFHKASIRKRFTKP